MINFRTHIGLLQHLPGMHYLEVPQDVVQALGTLNIRLFCTVNGQLKFQCGLMALGEGRAYISISKKRMQQLGIKLHDEVTVTLEKDDSTYGTDMPAEMEELLQQDEEGNRRFLLLKPGMQRYMLNHVSAVKSPQLRVDRAITLIENLKKLPEGKENFRAMLGLPPR
ncbi:DUF1905 domain-containing protein [Pontibacter chinhatensis]|uniref:Bacteriocin-protection, YdeI or OmpD-Associated n=1 Tax=Pontibacter chinhatensis TaxID=1436961 RepID=A0A1I2UA95_9BACT|nr:DUF1905 domain-containing protein [Pontibacter chinhatensis]SFG71551.1 Bacteriocin-protection, YdeI or OmpD-Associated [Pontibacter chinhatensis]